MKSLFSPYAPSQHYGMFGYAGFCCDAAISNNNPEMAEECWRRGWMDVTTQTFIGTVIEKCDRSAPMVAERLRALGPCKSEPEMVG